MQMIGGKSVPDGVTLETSGSGKMQIKDGGVGAGKLGDGAVTEKIGILTGTVNHGDTIPLPDGFTQAQCKWIVSPRGLDGYSNNGIDIVTCSADANRVVTVSITSPDGHNTTGSANYLIIGIK